MASVVWERLNKIKPSVKTIPPIVRGSARDFRPPATMEADFKRLLQHDIPHVNFTFELVHDWYRAQEYGYVPTYLRAQQTPIDWKSKIGNSDMSTNFKVTHEIPIYKGDMVVREDGTIFLLNWNVQNHPNNQATQSVECNTTFRFTRRGKEKVDENGFLIKAAEDEIIAGDIPGVHAEYAGRPDYSMAQGMPGIHADHLITCYVQWNSQTRNININDHFDINGFAYRVINISTAEVHIDGEYGVLTLHAKRVAGGDSGRDGEDDEEFC